MKFRLKITLLLIPLVALTILFFQPQELLANSSVSEIFDDFTVIHPRSKKVDLKSQIFRGRIVAFLVGNTFRCNPAHVGAATKEITRLSNKGYTVIIGPASRENFSLLWDSGFIQNIVFLGHGSDGDLSRNMARNYPDNPAIVQFTIDPDTLSRNPKIKLLFFIACETLKKKSIWAKKAPYAFIAGSKDPVQVSASEPLAEIIPSMLAYSARIKAGKIIEFENLPEIGAFIKREARKAQKQRANIEAATKKIQEQKKRDSLPVTDSQAEKAE